MSALLLNIILLGIGLKLYAFDYHMQRSRLLGTLLSAIGLCIDLQRRKNDVYIRGRLARQIDAASARFHFAYTRLPGHHIKPYSQELKKRASAGSQAIASTTSLLFCGSDELADLRDRLCRMTLRVSANDWLSIEQLVVGEGARKRMRPFGILLEPATIPLLVTALTLITAIVSVVGKALE